MTRFLGPRPRWVVHPFLFGAAYVLNTALANDVTPAGFVRPLIVVLITAGVLMVVGGLALGNRWDGALLTSAVMVAVVSPVSLAWLWFEIRGVFGAGVGTVVTTALLIAVLGALAIDILRRRRRGLPIRRPPPETLQILSVAVLVAVVGSNLITHPAALLPPRAEPVAGASQPAMTPDIVVILLDGYPRNDVLQRRLGTNNQAFLDGLRRRGFDVASDSRSNYVLTALTFATMFQMRYVDQIPTLQPLLGSGQPQFGALRDAAETGLAFSTLSSAGYEVVLSSAGWEHTTFRRVADRLLDTGELTDLERSLLHRTWLLYALNVVWPSIFADSQRNRIVHGFDALDSFASQPRDHPTFLLLHVPAPHLPLVVRADGTAADIPAVVFESIDREGFGMTDRQFAAAWESELTYLDDRVLAGVDLLLNSESGRNAVVVVMADHGYSFEVRQDDPQARLGNLFAARTPGAPGLLAEPPTPVNLFRTLFNRYFGTRLEILPDRYFLSTQFPLQLTEVENPDATAGP